MKKTSPKTLKKKSKETPYGTKNTWNLELLYSSPTDPKIEQDMKASEIEAEAFAKKYDVKMVNANLTLNKSKSGDSKMLSQGSKKASPTQQNFLHNNAILLQALTDYEKLSENPGLKSLLYFFYSKDMDASNTHASAQLALLEHRMTISSNKLTFFVVELSKISVSRQKEILTDNTLTHFKIFLERLFDDAKHILSAPEEKILSLKSLPGYSMWIAANDRILNMKTVSWKGKNIPLAQAVQTMSALSSPSDRSKIAAAIAVTLKSVAPIAEAEINAIVTDKKIEDELRGYQTPYEATVRGYHNDPAVIDSLRKAVGDNIKISQDFYRLKAKLIKLKKLSYADRAAKIGKIRATYTFDETVSKLKKTFGALSPKFSDFIDTYIQNGQIDVSPRVGKKGGAYCSSSYATPTFLLLNHTNDLHSYTTAAHELGHAFHSELSRSQGALYCDYSISLAETASTLFESIALGAVYDELSDTEKIIILHDRINDDISTIFRQIACFNYELDLHTTIRAKGYIPKEEIAQLHNKNMSPYLGNVFDLKEDDGYMFVAWSHIRRFFYVYTYAYGQLVSKTLLRRYKKDPIFWTKIEEFLSAGGSDSPEHIMKKIGVDLYSPDFWKEGLMEIADDIAELKRLTKKGKR
jgi:oligoendopeptidase F